MCPTINPVRARMLIGVAFKWSACLLQRHRLSMLMYLPVEPAGSGKDATRIWRL